MQQPSCVCGQKWKGFRYSRGAIKHLKKCEKAIDKYNNIIKLRKLQDFDDFDVTRNNKYSLMMF